jgi:ABC-type transport system involved in multi-copper enzyme maturation permease subunit
VATTTFRNTWAVAWHELADSIRSRRAIVLLILYVLGAVASTLLFVKLLHTLENQLEKTVGVAEAQKVGGTTSALWKNTEFKEIMTHLIGSRDAADRLLSFTPLALFFGWLSFTFTPLLVMLMSSARISEEIWSGSVRFVMFRTSRLSWCAGKFAGQALQLLAALLLSALAVWVTGWCRMAFFAPLPNALGLLAFALKGWVYSIAFLGLATGISQVVASPNVATALGFAAMVVAGILSSVAGWMKSEPWQTIFETVAMLLPGGHLMDLWLTDLAHALPATLFVLCLGAAYALAGFVPFSRRNL